PTIPDPGHDPSREARRHARVGGRLERLPGPPEAALEGPQLGTGRQPAPQGGGLLRRQLAAQLAQQVSLAHRLTPLSETVGRAPPCPRVSAGMARTSRLSTALSVVDRIAAISR